MEQLPNQNTPDDQSNQDVEHFSGGFNSEEQDSLKRADLEMEIHKIESEMASLDQAADEGLSSPSVYDDNRYRQEVALRGAKAKLTSMIEAVEPKAEPEAFQPEEPQLEDLKPAGRSVSRFILGLLRKK